MDWRRRPRPEAEMGRPFLGSLAVHGAVVVLALILSLGEPEQIEFMTFQVDIVAAPPEQVRDTPVPPTEEIVVETPNPTPPPQPEVTTPPPVVEDVVPDPEPDPTPPEPDPTPPEPDPVPEVRDDPPAAAAEPEEDTELSAAEVTIRMQGIQRDFPVYYRNIQTQIERCFRPPPGVNGVETTIYFEIRPNGRSAEERFEARSGNSSFDFEALRAIADCAGRNAAFGPLPEDWQYERMPILFTFRPRGEGR